MEYIKLLKSKKILVITAIIVIAVAMSAATGFIFYVKRLPTYTLIIKPTELLPFVSHEQARNTVCDKMKGQIFDEICQKEFDSVGKNDAKKIGALFSLLKKIENDRGINDYERSLLAQAIFASLPTKDSPLVQQSRFPALFLMLKDFINGTNIAYAKESNNNLGMGEKGFKEMMADDLAKVVSLPKGDNAWIINISVSTYGWVDGVRQPISSKEYVASYNPYPGVSTEDKDTWEQYDLTHVGSRVGSFASNQAMYSGPLTEGSGEMIAYSFTMASFYSKPYGSDSVLVVAEAGPSEYDYNNTHDFSEANYEGDDLLADLLANVTMPSRQQTTEDSQKKDGSQKTIPAHGTPISKSDYYHIIDKPGCDPWALYPETGLYCFTEEEMNAIGASGNLGQIRNNPPTYPFFDGNEPWRAPEKSPVETPIDEATNNSMSDEEKEYRQWLDCIGRPVPKTREELDARELEDSTPGTNCYKPNGVPCEKAANGTCIPSTINSVPR